MSKSETRVLQDARMVAPSQGATLFRNNVGALLDKTGRPVRYGLANETKEMNTALKSGDLIGWKCWRAADLIAHLQTLPPDAPFAQFVSLEGKKEDWTPSPSCPHEAAQRRWADLVRKAGGIAGFFRSAAEAVTLLSAGRK